MPRARITTARSTTIGPRLAIGRLWFDPSRQTLLRDVRPGRGEGHRRDEARRRSAVGPREFGPVIWDYRGCWRTTRRRGNGPLGSASPPPRIEKAASESLLISQAHGSLTPARAMTDVQLATRTSRLLWPQDSNLGYSTLPTARRWSARLPRSPKALNGAEVEAAIAGEGRPRAILTGRRVVHVGRSLSGWTYASRL